MHKNILVIGGTRYFGKLLVQRLLARRPPGHDRHPRPRAGPVRRAHRAHPRRPPQRSAPCARAFAMPALRRRVRPDVLQPPGRGDCGARLRRQGQALHRGLDHRRLPRPDGVSTTARSPRTTCNVLAQPIDTGYPWHDPTLAVESYVAGKVQAEAYLYRDGSLPLVTVRIGHVLAGAGRIHRAPGALRGPGCASGAPLRYANAAAASSFVERAGDRRLPRLGGSAGVHRAGQCGLRRRPVGLRHLPARVAWCSMRRCARCRSAQAGAAGRAVARSIYPQPLMMDTSRAASLGYRFGHCDDWLDDMIRQHDLAFV